MSCRAESTTQTLSSSRANADRPARAGNSNLHEDAILRRAFGREVSGVVRQSEHMRIAFHDDERDGPGRQLLHTTAPCGRSRKRCSDPPAVRSLHSASPG